MPLAGYLDVAPRDRRLLAFGFSLALASSFGQTYFIGIFGPGIQAEFGLSNTTWGTVYMLGTLASALLFAWTGRLIDRFDLRLYAGAVCVSLVAACALTASVTGPVMLTAAILLLRQSGQGLASHVAITSMARYFEAQRGRAIALATLGFAAGEAVLPVVAVVAIERLGWRGAYAAFAGALAVVLLPLVPWLLAGHGQRHRTWLQRQSAPHAGEGEGSAGWSHRRLLRDGRFLLLLPGILAPAFVLTAMFFHHLALADAKGWSHAWITGSYGVYAAAVVVASLASGRLVDRHGASRLIPFMLLPLAVGMVLAAWLEHAWSAWPYLFLLGITTGMALTGTSALWAELYGTAHLGAIRSLATALSVFASALGPVCMGGLMDIGMPIETVCLLFGAYALLGAVLIAVALAGDPRPPSSSRLA